MKVSRIRFFDSVFGVALALLLAPLVPAALTGLLHPSKPDWGRLARGGANETGDRIDMSEARLKYADALWLDARSRTDFEAAHVPGAIFLNEDEWEAQLPAVMERWDGRQAMMVYCGGESCHASDAVARRLRRELGEVKVLVLSGGWPAWQAEEAKR